MLMGVGQTFDLLEISKIGHSGTNKKLIINFYNLVKNGGHLNDFPSEKKNL